MPLLVFLHGYTSNGRQADHYMHLRQLADDRGFIVATPDGTATGGTSFWSATDACCNFVRSSVDDTGYLRALVEAVQAQFPVDSKQIYFSGHSNGGFMSYRMACDHADLIAGIASLAGAAFDHSPVRLTGIPAYSCSPVRPVSCRASSCRASSRRGLTAIGVG